MFINGTGSILPDIHFDFNNSPGEPVTGKMLKCEEPDYSGFIDARQIRRMSRIIKMGVTSSLLALKDAGISQPDAILVGTGYGCLEDTETFLKKMVLNNEEMLNPTPFISSTHNSIATQIALFLKSRKYNITYSHRNISFESTLIDARMLLNEKDAESVLAGGIDELTETSFDILSRLNTGHHFFLAGEGSVFFIISNNKSQKSIAEILDIKTFFNPDESLLSGYVESLFKKNNIDAPDLILTGNSFNAGEESAAKKLISKYNSLVLNYRNLCGEFPSSSSFALWLVTQIFKKDFIAGKILPGAGTKTMNKILIYNHSPGSPHHGLMLISAC